MQKQAKGLTSQEMCEFIAAVHLERTGNRIDPVVDIYLMSPNRDVLREAYDHAMAWKAGEVA